MNKEKSSAKNPNSLNKTDFKKEGIKKDTSRVPIFKVIKIGVNSDAAAIESVTDVNELTPRKHSITHKGNTVNTNSM